MMLLLAILWHFQIATAPYAFVFPRDHAAHFAYQSEWWYFTGHLRTQGGRRFGYELTFFRYGLRPGEMKLRPGESRWHGSQIYPAHFAITDERDGKYVHYERFAREALGMGYASAHRLDVRSSSWLLEDVSPHCHPEQRPKGALSRDRHNLCIHMQANADGNALNLTQTSTKPPAIHGHGGISRKAACASCASHYYSLTRLESTGTLAYGGVRYAVDGVSWMDHEFGSSQLQPDQVGWDWFSMQLDDGREVMLYRLRERSGATTPESSGSVIGRDGRVRYLAMRDFSIEAQGTWKSPHTGARYPSGWRVRIPSEGLDLTIVPTVRDQELADPQLGIAYWEGSCALDGVDRVHSVHGVGYVELTGYASAVHL